MANVAATTWRRASISGIIPADKHWSVEFLCVRTLSPLPAWTGCNGLATVITLQAIESQHKSSKVGDHQCSNVDSSTHCTDVPKTCKHGRACVSWPRAHGKGIACQRMSADTVCGASNRDVETAQDSWPSFRGRKPCTQARPSSASATVRAKRRVWLSGLAVHHAGVTHAGVTCLYVMPNCHKKEHRPDDERSPMATPQGYVQIPYKPLVVARVPAPPKPLWGLRNCMHSALREPSQVLLECRSPQCHSC